MWPRFRIRPDHSPSAPISTGDWRLCQLASVAETLTLRKKLPNPGRSERTRNRVVIVGRKAYFYPAEMDLEDRNGTSVPNSSFDLNRR